MAEFAASLFTSLASGGAAATGAATGAGAPLALLPAAPATGGFSGSVLYSILQGGTSLLGAMGALRAGQEAAAAYEAEADQAETDKAQAAVDGRVSRDGLRRDLAKQLGEQDVAYAASGTDLSFGTAVTARDQATRDAAGAISTDLGNEDMKKRRLQQRADALRRQAADARSAGGIKAFGTLFGNAASIAGRG